MKIQKHLIQIKQKIVMHTLLLIKNTTSKLDYSIVI